MTSSINYKDTLFKRSNLNPICGKPTFKMLHNLQNKIKSNAESVYSNFGGGAHGHLVLVLTDVQYALISPTTFVYLTHPDPLIIPDGTTAHASSNTWIAHTEKVRLFQEVTGVEQAIVQQIVATFEEAYLADICNTVTDMLTHLQYNYVQLIPHELLDCKEIANNTTCNP